MTLDINQFEQYLLSMNKNAARTLLVELKNSIGAIESVEELVVPVMLRLGSKWETGEVALSQVYMTGRICEELVDEILPPADPGRKGQPRMAIALFSDYHFLGKRIVYTLLRSSGYELYDYGQVETVEELAGRIRDDGIEIILISVLMLNSALRLKELTKLLKEERRGVKVVVGGAPFRFDRELWREIGADAMGGSAYEALEIIERISGGAL